MYDIQCGKAQEISRQVSELENIMTGLSERENLRDLLLQISSLQRAVYNELDRRKAAENGIANA